MKIKSALLLLSLLVGFLNHGRAQIPTDFTLGGMPKTNGMVPNLRITIITNVAYVVGYDETRKDPAWVAYKLVKKVPAFVLPRPTDGYPMDDQTLSKVPDNAYSDNDPDPLAGNKKWDHGHMAANDAIAKVFGETAQAATFKMSNMCPQSHRLNGGKWKSLESREYGYSQKYAEVWTICGPIFDKHLGTLKYGIEVPSSYYKIIVRKDGTKLKAMAVKFEYYPKLGGSSSAYLFDRLISISDLEHLTGLNFFSGLPDTVEHDLEATKSDTLW